MSKVKDNLKELEDRRRKLNGSNDLVEAEARSQQHNSTTAQSVSPTLVTLIVSSSNE